MTVTDAQAPPRLGGIDHLEWWVGNARAFAGFLSSGFGFTPVAHAGPETAVVTGCRISSSKATSASS